MKRVVREVTENSVEAVAREWRVKFHETWTAEHSGKILARLEKDIFPYVGQMPIMEVKPPDLLKAVRHIESRGALETAHRALQTCGKIFRYAVAGRAERDYKFDCVLVHSQEWKRGYLPVLSELSCVELS